MALGVTFPENEYVFAFGRKNEVLVLLVSKLGIYKRIGQLCWILAEKSILKGFTLLRHGDFTKCSNTCEKMFYLSWFLVALFGGYWI